MDAFLKFAYEFIWLLIVNIANFFISLGKAIWALCVTGWVGLYNVIVTFTNGFNPFQWFLAILMLLILAAIFALILYKIILAIVRNHKKKKEKIKDSDMVEEIAMLNQQVADLVDEKSKILALKVSQLGLMPSESDEAAEALIASAQEKKKEAPAEEHPVRFPKLASVDEYYAQLAANEDAQSIAWNETATLSDIVSLFRNYAASKLKLYYNEQTVRLFISGMAASKLIILEGVSGTGKTSLPYAFSRFLKNPCGMTSIQPSFRDRTELLGYYNEFTKRFNETEFLKYLYSALYCEMPSMILLDEMNLARIEYYFAEMLSVLEMPDPDEWLVDLVPVKWESDPKKFEDGKIRVSTDVWFVGTANNDDSTFTITDKVYDRAISIELNERATEFEAPDTPPIDLRSEYLQSLMANAKTDYPISQNMTDKVNKLDQYLQTRFKMAFGNRITKQMNDFVPVFVACGGTEAEAYDYIITHKILKKFESLNVSFIRDEIKELGVFVEKTFGKTGFSESKKYIQKLQAML